MLDYGVKIGLAPVRRFLPGPKRTGIFNPDYAVANKNRAVGYIKKNYASSNTQFCDLDFLNDQGMLYHSNQCETAACRFPPPSQKIWRRRLPCAGMTCL